MSIILDKQSVREAYSDVRSDSTDTNWVILKYDGSQIVVGDTGTEFEDFKVFFTDDARLFGYLRVTTGDEMSKRLKFVLLTWVGHDVSALKKARMSTDKAGVKEIIQSYSSEMFITEISELSLDLIREQVKKAGGANYGTGQA